MPGIHAAFTPTRRHEAERRTPASLIRESDYSVRRVHDERDLYCVVSGHEDYPVATLRCGDTLVVLEGMVYNMDNAEVQRRLARIAGLMENVEQAQVQVSRLVDEADGEFIVLMYGAQARTLLIFNDRWGRLPGYVYQDTGGLIFSRELKFVLPWLPSVRFNPLGVADFLLFEFVPGDGTVIKDVRALAPAVLIRSRAMGDSVYTSLVHLSAERLDDPPEPLSRHECCERFRDLLLDATRCRVKSLQERGYALTADLSGGFDSRLVCAALARTGAQVHLYTDALVTGDESAYAERVARALNRPLTRVSAEHVVERRLLADITVATDCTVNARTSLASRQDSVARLHRCGSRVVRFLGLGAGAFVKRAPKTKPGYASVGQQMLAGHQVGTGSLRRIAALLHLPTSTIVDHIDNLLAAFPETTRVGRLKRWHAEYERKLVSYGEDRSRAWLWPVAPLWSRDLYEFTLTRIPERYGHGVSGLYFQLLELLDPALVRTPVFSSTEVPPDGRTPVRQQALEAIVDAVRYAGLYVPGMAGAIERARRARTQPPSDEARLCSEMMTDLVAGPNRLWDIVDASRAGAAATTLSPTHSHRLLTLALYGHHLHSTSDAMTPPHSRESS